MKWLKDKLNRWFYIIAWACILVLSVNILLRASERFWPGEGEFSQQMGRVRELLWDSLIPGWMGAAKEVKNQPMIEYTPSASALAEAEKGQVMDRAQAENAQVLQEALVSENQQATAENQETGTESETEAPAVYASAFAKGPIGTVYEHSQLMDYNFLINQFYVVDSSTSAPSEIIDGQVLLSKDLTINLEGSEPKILIYHTHAHEDFVDSTGDTYGTVVGLGDTLAQVLEEKYGISVYHDTGVYDMVDGVLDRNEAYTQSKAAVQEILEENPSIKVVIDLHRDGVGEQVHLVTDVNGKPTAQIMFFNGMCRSAYNGENGYLQNPYLQDNLAFSLQLQLKAAAYFPDFTRRIYLRSYRYNLDVLPRALLVEVGAQTNTVAEAHNAMEPLADLLYAVLSGSV